MELDTLVVESQSHIPCSGALMIKGRNCCKHGPCKAKMPKIYRKDTESEIDSFARYRRREFYDQNLVRIRMPIGEKKLTYGKGFKSVKISNEW